jgi:hypothetical protein
MSTCCDFVCGKESTNDTKWKRIVQSAGNVGRVRADWIGFMENHTRIQVEKQGKLMSMSEYDCLEGK